ncbi:MAG: hypothetical protein Q8P57_01380 [Candidatus Pacearchaeota archaeon]|nr:hypothetical protein [Candidatus Pacearchaeota archaeon]
MRKNKIARPNMDTERMEAICLSGADGPLYRISEDKVAKFEWARDWTDWFCKVSPKGEKVQNEYEICKKLYENGVSVPKPYGVFMLKNPSDEEWTELWFPRRFPAFVMEYINGSVPHPKYLRPELHKRVDELVATERDKIEGLGIRPSDAMGWENTLWVPEKEQIYLIDFSRWQFTDK